MPLKLIRNHLLQLRLFPWILSLLFLFIFRHFGEKPIVVIAVNFNSSLLISELLKIQDGHIMRENSFFFGAAVVECELIHLPVSDYHRNIKVAHLRKFNWLLDEVTHPLALEIDTLQLIINLLLAMSLCGARLFVHL